MPNKLDVRRPDDPPSTTTTPASKEPGQTVNPEGGDRVAGGDAPEREKTGAGPLQASPAEQGSRKRNRGKGNSDMPPKEPIADLDTRHKVIGAGLRRIFDEIVEEPIPAEFLQLLNQIDQKRDQ